ncbi:MAG: hypothetical protein NVSMB49_01270 [Ktedonobacteraceae bacterium]
MRSRKNAHSVRKKFLLGHILASFILLVALIVLGTQSVQAAIKDTNPLVQYPLLQNPGQILGVEGSPGTTYSNITWRRMGYPTCGWGDLAGDTLKHTIQNYHDHGISVLLVICQPKPSDLFNTQLLDDAAQGGADAVQCGNEQMKVDDPSVSFLYVPPDQFARFFDLCQRAVHAVNPNTVTTMGSLDPHVGGIDIAPLWQQVDYLNQMQTAMNTSVYPGGHWSWRTQTIGLIDTWHNGYPTDATNSLYYLFHFWADRFGVSVDRGQLGAHLWVVEATGCFRGCGINPNNNAQVALVHVFSLITNAQTAMRYQVPHFFFSGKDFISVGFKWPIGLLDLNGNEKPLRQDLPMGARVLTMNCGGSSFIVSTQEDLLAKLYGGCTLPENYRTILTS